VKPLDKLYKACSLNSKYQNCFTVGERRLCVGNSQSSSGLAQNSTDRLSFAMNGLTNKKFFAAKDAKSAKKAK
jgi:hypothetical protein